MVVVTSLSGRPCSYLHTIISSHHVHWISFCTEFSASDGLDDGAVLKVLLNLSFCYYNYYYQYLTSRFKDSESLLINSTFHKFYFNYFYDLTIEL